PGAGPSLAAFGGRGHHYRGLIVVGPAPVANREMCQWAGPCRAGTVAVMLVQPQSLESLSAEQLREMVASLMGHVTAKDAQIVRHQTELKHSQALNAKLTHENALLKRMKFAAQS